MQENTIHCRICLLFHYLPGWELTRIPLLFYTWSIPVSYLVSAIFLQRRNRKIKSLRKFKIGSDYNSALLLVRIPWLYRDATYAMVFLNPFAIDGLLKTGKQLIFVWLWS